VPDIQPEDFYISLDELQTAGAKLRREPNGPQRARDPLARFLAVPNHAMFFFTSEDLMLDAYIRDHWAALDGLSGEICDIHVSMTQLQGLEDAYTQLNDVRSIRGLEKIEPSMLPALHIWSGVADLTFSLKDVDTDFDKLRKALRNIFSSMHSHGGPIDETWVTEMRVWHTTLSTPRGNDNAQLISGSTAGRDIIQISNFYASAPHIGDLIMSTSPTNKPQAAKGQTIEDAISGGKITQSSESEGESQAIRRAEATGDITQDQRKTSKMRFMGGTAQGRWGIVALVVVILALLAYKYFSKLA
jgi:hypothetical protein